MGRFKKKGNLNYREGSTMFLVKSICFRIFYKNYEILYENVWWRVWKLEKKKWKTQSMNWDDGDFFKSSSPSGLKK